MNDPERLVFANQLRGAAALMVLLNHWFGVYWRGRAFVAAATFSPPQPGGEPWIANLAATAWHNTGPFGVALFFLISGFVIPFSLSRHNPPSFIAARILRIYPVYWLAMAVELGVLWASSHRWDLPFALTWREMLHNALLIQNLEGVRSIDLVNWSLAIELKFYLLVAFLSPWILRGRLVPLFLSASSILAASALFLGQGGHAVALRALAAELGYLPYMFIGTAFKFHLEGRISGRCLAVAALSLLAVFAACLSFQIGDRAVAFSVAVNYAYALALFALAYRFRHCFREIGAVDALASISYPLYLTHAILGFSLLKWLSLAHGVALAPALAITLAATLGLSALLHVIIERPSIAWGHKLARRGRSPVDRI